MRYPQAGTANARRLARRRAAVAARASTSTGARTPHSTATCSSTSRTSEWSGAAPDPDAAHPRPAPAGVPRTRPGDRGRRPCCRAVTDDAWVELLPGTPRRLNDGRLLHSVDVGDTRRLWIDGEPFTPEDVLLREVIAVERDAVIATIIPKVASVALARLGFDGAVELLSDPDGVATGAAGGGTLVVAQQHPVRSGRRPPPSAPAAPGRARSRRWPKRSPLRAERGDPAGRRARAARRPCCSRPDTSAARDACRCCWTRTAARTDSASSTPRART